MSGGDLATGTVVIIMPSPTDVERSYRLQQLRKYTVTLGDPNVQVGGQPFQWKVDPQMLQGSTTVKLSKAPAGP